jgi:hypothetical protein
MGVLTIITLLLPTLTNLLGSTGIISPSLASLIGKVSSAIPTLVASLISGKSASSDIVAVLEAIKTEVDALKTSTTALLTLNQWNEITALDVALTSSIASYKNAVVIDDPSNLTELPTVL